MNIVVVDEEYQYVEPLGLLFVIFFALVMFFQLIGMVMHRIMTLGHIVSTTNIGITRVGMIYMNTQIKAVHLCLLFYPDLEAK